MYVLGIETSCDETAVAVVENGHGVRSNVISSQIARHAQYGGVVPELAAREHLPALPIVVARALDEARIAARDLHGIAVTHSPGLLPALLVGIAYAKGLAWGLKLPLLGVNHFKAHIFGATIDRPELMTDPHYYPLLALVVSGGHTALVAIDVNHECRLVGRTIDDAAGEAFDKAAKMLRLGYPGGPVIDRLAKSGNPHRYRFPRGLVGGAGTAVEADDRLNFSFSGVKTALLYHIKNIPGLISDRDDHHVQNQDFLDTIASYQEAVVDALIVKCRWALEAFAAKTLIVCGGVACNSRLRQQLTERIASANVRLVVTPPVYCTDNGAMIAGLGYYMLRKNSVSTYSLDARSRLDFTEVASFY